MPLPLFKTKQDTKLISLVEDRYAAARSAKVNLSAKWNRFLKLYKGEHWSKSTTKWRSKPAQNMVFALVESMVPLTLVA